MKQGVGIVFDFPECHGFVFHENGEGETEVQLIKLEECQNFLKTVILDQFVSDFFADIGGETQPKKSIGGRTDGFQNIQSISIYQLFDPWGSQPGELGEKYSDLVKGGVKQKETIAGFDALGAHHINMTATPIPRSYAMSVYGNTVDIITIPEMPAGRKVTVTKQVRSDEEVFERIYAELSVGHQAYIVTPFIEESDDEKFKDVASVAMAEAKAKKYYAENHPEVRVAAISGDMKQADILNVIDAFAAHQYDILVSTTIIEVGVNIPNATVIAIMNADRFGLSGLHQLRGRVGRKGDQGYCYLVSQKVSVKLDILCACHNGFEIAERDMALRGAGDLIGERQSGRDSAMAIETILRRPKLAAKVRKVFSEQFA